MRSTPIFSIAIVVSWLFASPLSAAQPYGESYRAALARAMLGAKISLATGLKASERLGTPVSARFEMEGDGVVVSVYAVKDETFREIVVNGRTGDIMRMEPVAGLKLAAARGEKSSMIGATLRLREAVANAERAHYGYRAVRAIPGVRAGRPVAEITLLRDSAFKTVAEDLY